MIRVLRIVLPWPPSTLSPNTRQHWTKLAKAKAAYRRQCADATFAQDDAMATGLSGCLYRGDLHLTLRFCPPANRRYDRDNLLCRMKAGLDGVCDALGFDDSRIEVITLRSLPCAGKPGHVELTLGVA